MFEFEKSTCASTLAVAAFALICGNAWALDDKDQVTPVPAVHEERFEAKINTWFDGTVTSVDAAGGSFVMRGSKRPYATAYAGMLKDIHAKTGKLDRAARLEKETEVRKAWAEKLNAAQKETWDKDSEIAFKLPSKDAPLSLHDESTFYGRTFSATSRDEDFPAARNSARTSEQKDQAKPVTLRLNELQVGEHVIVGYESGVLSNHAHAIIRARYSDFPRTDSTVADAPAGPADNTRVNARDNDGGVTAGSQGQGKDDIKITKLIRQAVVKDDSLSTYAHNIKIITKNGAVTLKGPVRSDLEKQTVGKLAVEAAGAGNVTNLIEIAP